MARWLTVALLWCAVSVVCLDCGQAKEKDVNEDESEEEDDVYHDDYNYYDGCGPPTPSEDEDDED